MGGLPAFHVHELVSEEQCKWLISEARVVVEGRISWSFSTNRYDPGQ
jgi:hypothetical protein